MFSMAKKFLGHVIPEVIRPIHILWNQVIGFFFIVLAVWPVTRLVHDWGQDGAGFRVGLEISFALLMGGFAIHSFLKARKISKP
jgi:hypothetical protein